VPEIDNWPEKRVESTRDQKELAMTAWCHGAIGIGISRIKLQAEANISLPEFVGRDIDRSLTHLTNRPTTNDESLCHGNFGNLELLVTAKEQGLLDTKESKEVNCLIAERIGFVAKHGLTSDSPSHPTLFSIMTGWAGIGYQLLRFAHPNGIPSILLMDGFAE